MQKEQYDDGIVLHSTINVPGRIIGLVVDYLFRYISTGDARKAFAISLWGSDIAEERESAEFLLSQIKGVDERSVVSAINLVTYDFWFRDGVPFRFDNDPLSIDKSAIEYIEILLQRCIHFLEKHGPVTKAGLFFHGAFTPIIQSGDGDFMTESTIWDMKVSDKRATNKQSLQVLIYYLLGLHSDDKEQYRTIKNIGIFNPLLNRTYLFALDQLSDKTIDEICSVIIGYGWRPEEYYDYYQFHNWDIYEEDWKEWTEWLKHADPSSPINHLAQVQGIDKEYIDYFGTEENRINNLLADISRNNIKDKDNIKKQYVEDTVINTRKWGRGIIVKTYEVYKVPYCQVVFLETGKVQDIQLRDVKRIDLLNSSHRRIGLE